MGMKTNFVHAFAGHSVPDSILERLIKKYPSSWSMAAIDKDTSSVMIERHIGQATLEEIQKNREEFKDWGVVFSFGQTTDAASHEEDVQPFAVLNIGGQPAMAIFMMGDFGQYHKTESARSDEFFAAQDLTQTLGSLAQMAGEDLLKITNHVNAKAYDQTLFNMSNGPAAFCILSGNGEITHKQNKDNFGTFVWGILADTVDIEGASEVKENEVIAAASTSPFAARRAKQGTKVMGDLAPASKPKPAETSTAVERAQTAGKPQMVTPPNRAVWITDTNKYKVPIKEYYRAFNVNGQVPQNWKTIPDHEVKPSAIKSFHELAERIKASANPSAGAKPAEGKKPEVSGVHTLKDPVNLKVPPETIAEFKKNVWPKILDSGSSLMKNPEELALDEAKAPSFHDQTGVPLAKIVDLPRWAIVQMAHDVPGLLAQAFIDLKRDNREVTRLLAEATEPERKGNEIPEGKPAEPAKQPEVKPAEPAAQPASSGSPFAARRAKKAM